MEKLPYWKLCGCNPENGGSGICMCTTADKLIDKIQTVTIASTTSNIKLNNMQDRIQINGEWYVKESNTTIKNDDTDSSFDETDVTEFHGFVYEDSSYCWETSRIKDDSDDTYFEDFTVEFTDKKIKPWKEEIWDNSSWFQLLLDGDKEAHGHALESMTEEGIKTFKSFLRFLQKKDWL